MYGIMFDTLSFSKILARKFGIGPALVLQILANWERSHYNNQAKFKDTHHFDDRWWTYQSLDAWVSDLPYSKRGIQKIIEKLKKLNIISVKKFGGKFDRTNYYSINWDQFADQIPGTDMPPWWTNNPVIPDVELRSDRCSTLCHRRAHRVPPTSAQSAISSSSLYNHTLHTYSTTGNEAGCPDEQINFTQSSPASSSIKSGPKFSETDRPQKCLDHENQGREILAKLKKLRPGILGSEEKFIDFWNQNPQPLKLTSDRLKWISASPSIKMNLHRLDGYFTLFSADSFMRVESYKRREQIRDDYRLAINADERQSVIRLSADDLGCTETDIVEWANLNNNDPYFRPKQVNNDNIILANLNF